MYSLECWEEGIISGASWWNVSQEVGAEQDLASLRGGPLGGTEYASHKGWLSHTNSLALLVMFEDLFMITYTKTGRCFIALK